LRPEQVSCAIDEMNKIKPEIGELPAAEEFWHSSIATAVAWSDYHQDITWADSSCLSSDLDLAMPSAAYACTQTRMRAERAKRANQ